MGLQWMRKIVTSLVTNRPLALDDRSWKTFSHPFWILLKLRCNLLQLLRFEIFLDPLDEILLSNVLNLQPAAADYRRRHCVTLRMDVGGVQQIELFDSSRQTANPHEASALRERLGSDGFDLEQVRSRLETSVVVSMLHNRFRSLLGQAGDVLEQTQAGDVQIHADEADALADDLVERFIQHLLVHVVLVHADAQVLRVDLDELAEWIEQASGDGNGADEGDVELGKFAFGQLAARVDGRALFGHDAILRVLVVRLDEVADEALCLAARRGVADRDQRAVELLQQSADDLRGLLDAAFVVRVDHVVGLEQLAGFGDHRQLAAACEARVDAEDFAALDGVR